MATSACDDADASPSAGAEVPHTQPCESPASESATAQSAAFVAALNLKVLTLKRTLRPTICPVAEIIEEKGGDSSYILRASIRRITLCGRWQHWLYSGLATVASESPSSRRTEQAAAPFLEVRGR